MAENNAKAPEQESNFKALVLPVIVLVVICLVCSALLAVLNNATAPIIEANTNVDAYVAENQMRYEMLVYQYENDIYDNDNDLGKRDLMEDIQKWNEDLAYNRKAQDDFWVGIFYPNVYDQFEFIELK